MIARLLCLFLVISALAGPALAQIGDVAAQRSALAQAQQALDLEDRDAAFSALERAVAAGFSGLERLIARPEYTALRIAPGMSALLERSAAMRPRPVVRRTAGTQDLPLTSDVLIWDAKTRRFEVTADLNDTADQPLLAASGDGATLPADLAPALARLQALHAAGRACGLGGVLYDNRDRGHSTFPFKAFPQLTRTTYEAPLRQRSLDYGLGSKLRFSAPTFGNSSTMYKGRTGRALPRRSMTYGDGAAQAFANYSANHLYVFPGGGDPFPANWPYSFASSGHSGSDQWMMRAVALILAALPCDTRAFAQARGLIAPTVQMVFRRAQAGVTDRADYLSGAAHPMIFRDSAANPRAMIELAARLRPEDLPPMVRLEMVEESFSEAAGLLGRSERLFDTPSAIARVWRGFAGQHRMVVSVAATQDPNGRALDWDVTLLRGDPERVRITRLGDGLAEIIIDWHDKIALNPERVARVDIGFFAHNGVHDSAPGFVSVQFPSHQARRYTRGPGGVPRLVSINYNTSRRFDPILFWRAPWEDIFGFDDSGKLMGWVRKTGEMRERYLASGQPADGRQVAYILEQSGKDLPVLRLSR